MRPQKKSIYIMLVAVFVATGAAMGIASAIGGSAPRDPMVVSGNFADLVAQVSAINHDRRTSDTLPPAAQQALARIPGANLPADAIENARMVFDGAVVGPVFVVPTTEGFALVSSGGISIVPGALGRANPTAGLVEQRSPSDPVTAFGIAIDDVARVEVIAGGKTYSANLTGNGYEWVASAPVVMDDVRLLIHLSDGTVVRS